MKPNILGVKKPVPIPCRVGELPALPPESVPCARKVTVKIHGTSNFRNVKMGLAEDTERTTEPDRGAEAVLEDISDGLEALMAVPVCILSTWRVTHHVL